MSVRYQDFQKQNIDLGPLGVEGCRDNSPYFCTPKGAQIFGWAGVDGIHYCFVPGYGETVFAVNPMDPPAYVKPLARNFADFLRLLLACGDAGALEQAGAWTQQQFDDFLQENAPGPVQQEILARIAWQMHLTPMEQPLAYLQQVQAETDLRGIEYEEMPEPETPPQPQPAWKVYYSGNFSTRDRLERPGQEWRCDAYSGWAGQQWYIPAVYLCGKGLVADICRRVPREQLKAYRDKWAAYDGQDDVPEEIYQQAAAEDPFEAIDYQTEVTVNGRTMEFKHGIGLYYNPYTMQENTDEDEAYQAVAHYGLDAAQGWEIQRWTFPWATRRRPKTLASLVLKFLAREQPHPAVRFRAVPGQVVQFAHPVSGVPCTLTVQALEPVQLPEKDFPHAEAWDWPRCCVQMQYTLAPAPAEGWVQVNDLARNDQPVQKKQVEDSNHPGAGVIAVIGGADGPTAIFVAGKAEGAVRTAVSAAHFAPVPPQEVEWEVVFYQKNALDETVRLL